MYHGGGERGEMGNYGYYVEIIRNMPFQANEFQYDKHRVEIKENHKRLSLVLQSV